MSTTDAGAKHPWRAQAQATIPVESNPFFPLFLSVMARSWLQVSVLFSVLVLRTNITSRDTHLRPLIHTLLELTKP